MSAGLIPLFTSAPRIKLLIDDVVAGYAIGFNLNISIDVQPVQVIGKFGPQSLEPTMYNIVTGTIQILKLVSGSTFVDQAEAVGALLDSTQTGAAVVKTLDVNGNPQTELISSVQAQSVANPGTGDSNSLLGKASLATHLDPAKVLLSRTFDMNIKLLLPAADGIASISPGSKNLATAFPKPDEESWLRIKYCRLTSRNTSIANGQLVNEPCNFQGLIVTHAGPGLPEFKLDQSFKDKL